MASTAVQLVVIGAGPGGYAAAFFAADLGMQVTLVDRELNPGGVCLYRGCIPSKALLHVAKVAAEAKHAEAWGLKYAAPTIDLDKVRAFKDSVVAKLTGGVAIIHVGGASVPNGLCSVSDDTLVGRCGDLSRSSW